VRTRSFSFPSGGVSHGRQEAENHLTGTGLLMEPLFSSQAPQELPPYLRWRTIKVRTGTHGPLVLAGPPQGLTTHHPAGRTVPCAARLPGCSIVCPWCRFTKRFTCYVPLFDPSQRKQDRIVVMGGKRTWESVAGMQPGSLVCMLRGSGERDTTLFRPWNEAVHPAVHHRWVKQCPQDITRYLLHLWQWRELTESFKAEWFPSITTEEIEAGIRGIRPTAPRDAHGE
jgi:hypothetical protein